MDNKVTIPRHKRGDSWNGLEIDWTDDNEQPIDLTGYTVKVDFKETANGQPIMRWSTIDGTITVNALGKIRLLGRKINVPAKRYVADVETTSPSDYTQTIVDYAWEIHQDITT